MKSFLFDHLALIALILGTTVYLVLFPASPLVFSLLYFGLPILYLLARRPSLIRLALIPALLFGVLYGISFEYINEVSVSWVFPRAHQFYFPEMFFGLVPGDVIVWYFLWVFIIVSYYEYFIDSPYVPKLQLRRVGKAIVLGLLPLSVIALSKYVFDVSLAIPYAYTVTCIATLAPVYILYRRKPGIFPKLVRTIPFLSVFFLIMECVALYTGEWQFITGYSYAFTVYGFLVPIEEIVFWIILSPLIIAAYHELFLDDER